MRSGEIFLDGSLKVVQVFYGSDLSRQAVPVPGCSWDESEFVTNNTDMLFNIGNLT